MAVTRKVKPNELNNAINNLMTEKERPAPKAAAPAKADTKTSICFQINTSTKKMRLCNKKATLFYNVYCALKRN